MKKIISILIVPFLFACSGSTLTGSPDGSISVDGKELTILSVRTGHATFTNDLGFDITLQKAGVSWGHIHLISEGDDPECEAGHDTTLHVEGIDDLLAAGTETSLGTEMIEDHSYCQYHIEFESGDEEISGADEFPEMIGRSVYVEGLWSDGATNGTFQIVLTDTLEVEGIFKTSTGVAHALHYHEGETAKTIRFGLDTSVWFEGIDFTESVADLQNELAANLQTSFGQRYVDVVPH